MAVIEFMQSTRKTLVAHLRSDSLVYRIDPVSRIALGLVPNLLFVYVRAIYSWSNPMCFYWAIGEIIFVSGLMILFRVEMRSMVRFLAAFATLTATILLAFAFFGGRGTALVFSLGPVAIYLSNVFTGVIVALNVIGSVFGVVLILLTCSERDIVLALQRLRFPHFVYLIVGLTLRSLTTLFEDISTILQAQESRALDLKNSSFVKKIKVYSSLLIPLIMMEMSRADSISNSIDSRGFSISGRRTKYLLSQNKFGLQDYVIVCAVVLFLIVLLAVF